MYLVHEIRDILFLDGKSLIKLSIMSLYHTMDFLLRWKKFNDMIKMTFLSNSSKKIGCPEFLACFLGPLLWRASLSSWTHSQVYIRPKGCPIIFYGIAFFKFL